MNFSRPSSAAYFFAALLFVLASHPAHAGWLDKNQSVPQWGLDAARISTPAYANDASSVLLFDEYVETIDAQGRATERERTAIRILKPQGRGDGACGVSYDVDKKINYFHAWTIAADGHQYPAKDTDFTDVGNTSIPIMLSTEKARVAHPPAVDVGATVLCESEELLAPYQQEKVWHIQSTTPAVQQALEIDLPPNRPYVASWHRFEPVTPVEVAPNHWRWQVNDVRALDLRGVRAHPAWEALAARMSVTWGDAAVAGKDNQWRAFGEWTTKLEAGRPDPTPEITAQTQQLIAGAPDFYTKLKSVTEYIQKNIQYFVVMRGIGGWQAHPAGGIFHNRYGDCKDKTTLLISMLHVAGIRAYYVPVDDHRGVIDPDAPSYYGDHMITAIEVPADVNDPRLMAITKGKDGKRYLIFDPTNERVPVGNLPSYEQGGYGILAAGPSSQLLVLPVLPPDASLTERKGSFALTADGTLEGSVETTRAGDSGADLRWDMKESSEHERHTAFEKSLARDLPGVTLGSLTFVQPPDLDKPIEVHYRVTVPGYAHTAGPLLLVRPRVVGEDALPFDDKTRTLPINLDATGRWHDSFDITLPAGYVVDDVPDPVRVQTDFAAYHSTVSAHGNVLHYERDYAVTKVELPATRAADFRKFESAVLEDEEGAAILKKQ